jgi:Ca2+-binding RTX toxin-like protein
MFSGVDVLYNYVIHNNEDGTANIAPVFHIGNSIYSEDWTDSIGQTILGGAGNDTLSFDNINNGVLLDFVFGIGTLDEVNAEGVLGSDGIGEVIYFVLEGQTYHSFEKIIGSKVNDYIVNLTPWDHFMEIFGGQGNDNLIGSYGNEILSGGMGNDIISGGYGVDTLSGGEGFDKFIILDDTPTEEFKKQWVLSNPEDQANIEADNIFKSEDTIKDFKIGVDTIDLTAISNSGVDLSDNVDINDLSVKQKNEFDAVMEIKNTSTVDVSITLENFGSVSQQTEEELLQSILV